ncbi:MAG: Xaa-Pro dipeptidase [Gammaproteobacteria bacterium]|nr:Xaa-Pro dipeptidase [Gammaproteobacteria bacterium]
MGAHSTFDRDGYRAHLAAVSTIWDDAMQTAGADAVIVPAGANRLYFQDDQAPPFRPNPHFAHWVPDANCEHSVLLYARGSTPKLFFYKPVDYWHLPPDVPAFLDGEFELEVHADLDALTASVVSTAARSNHVAYIGEADQLDHNLPLAAINPAPLVNRLQYARAYKTPFEADNMRRATDIGVAGHIAARSAFFAGASEFEIHMAYLRASRQVEADLPYQSIVALNEHAGVLHYQHYRRDVPAVTRSLLIDAGGRHLGYASDITRTYSAGDDEFAELIAALDAAQQALTADIRPGISYVDLHERMHHDIGGLLAQFDFVSCGAEEAFDAGITDAFFPHGLGHLLGLQTHDVGGQFAGEDGHLSAPPERYPALRLTRNVEPDQIFTIEPGLYFIPMLLEPWRDDARLNWAKIETYLACGGIRIEDNIRVTTGGFENLTRDAFDRAGDELAGGELADT